MNIYVSNLDSNISDTDLKNLFTSHGEVKSAEVVTDAFNGKSRGFGYVEMENDENAQKAIESLNNSKVSDLTISVQEAKPKTVSKGSYKVGNGIVKEYRFKKS